MEHRKGKQSQGDAKASPGKGWRASMPLLLLPVHIALLHLVIDPACTVVFEAMPGDPALLRSPPGPRKRVGMGLAAVPLALLPHNLREADG
jgi:hypothetical protein